MHRKLLLAEAQLFSLDASDVAAYHTVTNVLLRTVLVPNCVPLDR